MVQDINLWIPSIEVTRKALAEGNVSIKLLNLLDDALLVIQIVQRRRIPNQVKYVFVGGQFQHRRLYNHGKLFMCDHETITPDNGKHTIVLQVQSRFQTSSNGRNFWGRMVKPAPLLAVTTTRGKAIIGELGNGTRFHVGM